MQNRYLYFFMIVVLFISFGIDTAPLQAQDDSTPTDTIETASVVTELLVYDVNRPLTKQDRGFPHDQPPRSSANGNWKSPVNFAEGTMYYRVEIRHQPQPQTMRLQFCVWQDSFNLENCGAQQRLIGNPHTVVTWNQPVKTMWKKEGKSIDWSRARQRYGIAVKNAKGKPVSDLAGWNWSGENPNLWYPMDMRFTVVVVAKGATFSGWQHYVGGSSATVGAATSADTALVGDADLVSSDLTWEAMLEQEAAQQPEQLDNIYFLPLVTVQ